MPVDEGGIKVTGKDNPDIERGMKEINNRNSQTRKKDRQGEKKKKNKHV